jgi:hypothetical protein
MRGLLVHSSTNPCRTCAHPQYPLSNVAGEANAGGDCFPSDIIDFTLRDISPSDVTHFADKLHIDKQKIDLVESVVLLSLIGGGLALCVLGAAAFDIGRLFSVW